MSTTTPPAPSSVPSPPAARDGGRYTASERQLAERSPWARLGSFAFRRRWLVLGAWIAVLVAVFGAVGTVGTSTDSSFESPDSESQLGFEVLEANFGGSGSFLSGSIVFRAAQGVAAPEVAAAMEPLFAEIGAIEEVSLTSPYSPDGDAQGLVSPDGTIAYARIDIANGTEEVRASEIGVEVNTAIGQLAAVDGLQVEVGGAALAEFEPPQTELIGLAFAVVILILAFGSVLAMGLPIGVALFGVGIGVGLITLLTHVLSIPDFATTLGAMIGIGVGIDYALFIVTRYREGTKAGMSPHLATMTALDTAGRAVVFAGLTVVISLLGMYVIGLAFISGLATGAALTVAVTMLASITLLPALIGFAQQRVEVTRWRGLIAAGFVALFLLGLGLRIEMLAAVSLVLAVATIVLSFVVPGLRAALPPRREKPLRDTLPYRWSRFVQRRPWPVAIGVAVLLIAIALPVFSLRLGFSDESTYSEDTTTRQAYDLLAEGFGPGSNGPLILVSEVSGPDDLAAAQRLVAALAADPGISQALGPQPSPNGQAIQIFVIPATGPQDEATTTLVRTIRADIVPAATAGSGLDVKVTGSTAASVDFTDYLGERIPYFFVAVLTLSFLLLMMVFRSVLVPLKAVIMNLLSIGGAYGIVVAVFQWGWGIDLFGTASGPIEPFLPMMLFAIVFGLSMDYEVFLLSRVKEEYDRSGDPVNSVADGLASTARVITAAAAIMVVVFGSFVLEDNRIIKMFGLGLASAVFLDATLVRMLLVPATMELLGARNWWLPKWLDRILPTLHVEGSDVHVGASPDAAAEPDDASELVGSSS